MWAKLIYTNQDQMGFIPTSIVLAQSCDSQTRSGFQNAESLPQVLEVIITAFVGTDF